MSTVRILLVTDDDGGFQRSTSNEHKWHLGEFVRVLIETDWKGFDIQLTRAHRSNDPAPGTPQASHPIGADLYGFRFSAASLDGFDMAFFFSTARKNEDPVTLDADHQTEAVAVAAFMEAGKGFFASGDHEDLGAAICQHIPRVRSMRRWAYPNAGPHGGPVAPSGLEANRHDTLQPGSDTGVLNGTTYTFQFNDQSDAIPQPLKVKSYTVYRSRWFASTLPHPLLCSPLGRINVLPDHMHEGWCEIPSDLTRDENLPGRAGKKEYPLNAEGERVEPEVIAWATVLPHETLNQEFLEFGGSYALSPMTTTTQPFGVIGAYDGHRAGIGRVVVDATWHHFVNINLIGTSASFAGINPAKTKGFYAGPGNTPVPEYEKIIWYYRNLVYWLIPANHQRRILLKGFADALHKHPRWEELKGSTPRSDSELHYTLRFAQLAEEYFNQELGPCFKYQAVPVILFPIRKFDPHIWEEFIPEIDPWNPLSERLGRTLKPLPGWRQAFLPDAGVRWYSLLGCLAIAVSENIRRHEEVTDKHFEAIQQRTLELLPRTLELASEEIDAGIRSATQLGAGLKEMAAALARLRGAQ